MFFVEIHGTEARKKNFVIEPNARKNVAEENRSIFVDF